MNLVWCTKYRKDVLKGETVLKGENFVAFATNHDMAFVSDVDAGTIIQVVKDGQWLSRPIEFVTGLKGPQGMTFGIHGNLIVMEKNTDPYNGRMLSIDLKTKEITVLADALGVDPSVEKRNWKVLKPHSTVAQTLDGTIYFTEPGATSFSVLRPQN